MKDTFQLGRFCNYFAFTVKNDYKQYLMALGAALGILLLIMLMPVLSDGAIYIENQTGAFYGNEANIDPMFDELYSLLAAGLFIIAILSASLTFSNLKNKYNRIQALTLPASQLEKYITRWVIYLPLAVLAFVLTFEVADLIRCFVIYLRVPDSNYIKPFFADGGCQLFTDWFTLGTFSFLFMFQGVYLLGSAIWPKLSVLKTSLAVFAIGMAIIMLSLWIGSAVFEPQMHYGFGDEWNDAGGTAIKLLSCANYTVGVICWIISYFRIKEIEIIQRW